MQESLAPGIEDTPGLRGTGRHVPASPAGRSALDSQHGGPDRGDLPRADPAHLDEGETSVGTHVCVSHEAAVNVGEHVTVWCRLNAVQKRRLEFEVRVEGPRGSVSNGTHQRAVINTSRFG